MAQSWTVCAVCGAGWGEHDDECPECGDAKSAEVASIRRIADALGIDLGPRGDDT